MMMMLSRRTGIHLVRDVCSFGHTSPLCCEIFIVQRSIESMDFLYALYQNFRSKQQTALVRLLAVQQILQLAADSLAGSLYITLLLCAFTAAVVLSLPYSAPSGAAPYTKISSTVIGYGQQYLSHFANHARKEVHFEEFSEKVALQAHHVYAGAHREEVVVVGDNIYKSIGLTMTFKQTGALWHQCISIFFLAKLFHWYNNLNGSLNPTISFTAQQHTNSWTFFSNLMR